jgi:hypothetical protein
MRHGKTQQIVLWVSDDKNPDHFLKNDGGEVVTGKSKLGILKQIKPTQRDKIDWGTKTTYDFDKFRVAVRYIKAGCSSKTSTCLTLNNGWNFLEDMLHTLTASRNFLIFTHAKLAKVYQKFFLGCNLPAVTPEGKSYHPLWTASEAKSFGKSMRELLHFIQKSAPYLNI